MPSRSQEAVIGVGVAGIAGIVGYGLWSQYKDNQAAAAKAQELKGKQITDAAIADQEAKRQEAMGNAIAAEAQRARQQELLGKQIQTQAQIDYYRGQASKAESSITQIAAQKGINLTSDQLATQASSETSKMSMYTTMGIGVAVLLGLVLFLGKGKLGYRALGRKSRKRR